MADVCLCRRNVVWMSGANCLSDTKNDRSFGGGFFMRHDLAEGQDLKADMPGCSR